MMPDMRSRVGTLTLVGSALLVACGSGSPEAPDPEAFVTGNVTIGGAPPRGGEAVVITLRPDGSRIVTGIEDGGAYRIEATEVDQVCASYSVAWADNEDFPLVSDVRGAVVDPADPCVGNLPGPDFDLPARDAPTTTARVSGIVTVAGRAAVTDVSLLLLHPIWQSDALAETVSDTDGSYELEADLPLHYCPFLVALAINEVTPVALCGEATVDVVR